MNTNIIVIRYTPYSEKKYIQVLKNGYKEVVDPSIATTFLKKVEAIGWIRRNFRDSEFARVEDLKHHLKPLRN